MEESLPPHVATHPIEWVYKHLERYHGIPAHVARERLHKLKDQNGLPPDFDLLFHRTGNVYRADDRTYLGSLTSGGTRVRSRVMSEELKRNKKYSHLYAIVRYEAEADPATPIDLRVTVKKVVTDPHYAEKEVQRLNSLNKEKGSYYFCQVTRLEEVPVQVEAVPPILSSGNIPVSTNESHHEPSPP